MHHYFGNHFKGEVVYRSKAG